MLESCSQCSTVPNKSNEKSEDVKFVCFRLITCDCMHLRIEIAHVKYWQHSNVTKPHFIKITQKDNQAIYFKHVRSHNTIYCNEAWNSRNMALLFFFFNKSFFNQRTEVLNLPKILNINMSN